MSHSIWSRDWFPLPGQAVFDRDKQQLAAISRAPGNLDLFVIGFDNRVWSTFWGTFQHEFNGQIVTGGLAALGGSYKVTIYGDGAVRWQGEATNSGIDSYDFGLSALVKTPSGRAVALVRTGSIPNRVPVFGDTIRRSWDELQPPNPVIAVHFDEFAGADFSTNIEYESGISGALQKMVGWLIQFGVGSVIGPVGGAVVFIGVEVGSLATTGSLVPGARIVGNVLWLAGPDYSSFNLEQQAQIVSDWFAGAVQSGSNQTGISKDINSPYFQYINANVRIGRF